MLFFKRGITRSQHFLNTDALQRAVDLFREITADMLLN